MKTVLVFLVMNLVFLLLLDSCRQQGQQDSEQIKDTTMLDTATTVSENSKFKSGYAAVNGIKMYYEIYGESKPLILIHGGGSTIQTSFSRIIPALSRNRKVIGVELQAHGRTGDRNTPISFEQDADDVAQLLHILKIDKADFFGFSNGGNTVMQIAIRHPQLADKIIIASSFYKRSGLPPQFWEFMKKGTIDDMPQVLKDAFLKVTPDSAKLQNLFEKCSQRMLQFKDWDKSQLEAIKSKTLIVTGDKDVATLEHVIEMHRLIPQSQVLVIPGGHGQYMGEISFADTEANAASFLPLVEKFLTD
jgi:pimeloyl-ACP methyl ester carboxylesterase